MEKWYQKLRRGDVWFVSLNRGDGDGIVGSSVERKSRPYLIVSCEENNRNAPIVNAIPITTRDKDDYPMHVYYRFEDRKESRNQIIMCEQITTLSALLFDKPQTYFMYSLAPELMEKVNKALSSQLGLEIPPVGLDELEKLIEKLAEQKLEEIRVKAKESAAVQVTQIVDNLKEKFSQPLSESDQLIEFSRKHPEVVTEDQVRGVLAIPDGTIEGYELREELKKKIEEAEKKSEPVMSEQTSQVIPPYGVNVIRKKGDPWTAELEEYFLNDYPRLTKDALSRKYGISKKTVYIVHWKICSKRQAENTSNAESKSS